MGTYCLTQFDQFCRILFWNLIVDSNIVQLHHKQQYLKRFFDYELLKILKIDYIWIEAIWTKMLILKFRIMSIKNELKEYLKL